jgi:hypothetical protein
MKNMYKYLSLFLSLQYIDSKKTSKSEREMGKEWKEDTSDRRSTNRKKSEIEI